MYKRTLVLAGIVAGTTAHAAPPTQEEMWEIIQQQQKQIEELKGRLQETDSRVEATADAVETVASSGGASASWASKTSIGGYGEHHFNHKEDGDDQIDAHRFVVYIGHQFSDTVRFFSEVELEHSLAGDGKPGEVELEQAYIEWDFAANHRVQMGQFLLPVGILNETHEPDTFYGVERNNVESRIIPTTWWETGVKVTGELAPGFNYDVAVHSGLNVGWDATNMEPEAIRSGRQKSAEAVAEDLAFTARLKYTGVAGLELAGTYQLQQDLSQGSQDPADLTGSAEASLMEFHAVYQTGRLSLKALWAAWDIDGDSFELAGSDEQEGYYVETGYKLTKKLGAFVRYSEWDLEGGNSLDTEQEQIDYGINYWIHPQVVLKADYSDDRDDVGSDRDAMNLGVGWSF